MHKTRISLTSLIMPALFGALLGTAVSAQPPGGPEAAERNARPDNIGTGPYPAMKEELPTLPRHVVYRPQNLSAMGSQKLGVYAWGNGGCSDDAASTRFHLLEVASHGYLVIAAGRIYSGPGAHERPPRDNAGPGAMSATDADDLSDAIDWALSENAREGSPYYGRIDPAQVAVSGFSCGGVQAISNAGDPRISTMVLMNTGILNTLPEGMGGGMAVGKEQLEKIHTPLIYILGGEEDIAYVNGMDDYERINNVPVAVASLPVGHGGTYFEENGGSAAQVAVNWLQWVLRGDKEAAKYFTGSNCVLCKDEDWTLISKNLGDIK